MPRSSAGFWAPRKYRRGPSAPRKAGSARAMASAASTARRAWSISRSNSTLAPATGPISHDRGALSRMAWARRIRSSARPSGPWSRRMGARGIRPCLGLSAEVAPGRASRAAASSRPPWAARAPASAIACTASGLLPATGTRAHRRRTGLTAWPLAWANADSALPKARRAAPASPDRRAARPSSMAVRASPRLARVASAGIRASRPRGSSSPGMMMAMAAARRARRRPLPNRRGESTRGSAPVRSTTCSPTTCPRSLGTRFPGSGPPASGPS